MLASTPTRLASALHHVGARLHRVGACSFHSGAQPDCVGVRSFHAIARPYRLGECNEWRFAAVLEGPGEYTRRVLLHNACSERCSLSPYFANQVKNCSKSGSCSFARQILALFGAIGLRFCPVRVFVRDRMAQAVPPRRFLRCCRRVQILPAVASSRPPQASSSVVALPKPLPAVASPSPKVCFLTTLLPCPMSQAQGSTFHLGNPAFPPYFMSESL